MKKQIISLVLALTIMVSIVTSSLTPAETEVIEDDGITSFQTELAGKYEDPDRVYSTDVRWWIGEAANTDESLLDEIQALYDAGFRGVELCMQSDSAADNATYAYGSAMWAHKWKLMIHKLLDLGMGVYLTSGTNWSTSNVPGLDPDSQEAMHVAAISSSMITLTSGDTYSGAITAPSTKRNEADFIGAYAYKQTADNTADYDSIIDISEYVLDGGDGYTQNITWTAPDTDTWRIYGLWSQGNYHSSSPAAETSYCTNYFDERGVEALKEFWEANYLDDPELNEKILNGDVHLFMDSIEINTSGGITWWAEDMAEEFG